mgnify:CR=1 FL=1
MDWRNMTFTETIQALLALKTKYPKISSVYIEDTANGPAIIDVLSKKIPGVTPVQPSGGKESRVQAITPFLEAGNVLLPAQAKWRDAFIEECVSFPRGAHDDALDAMAYAVEKLLFGRNIATFQSLASFRF